MNIPRAVFHPISVLWLLRPLHLNNLGTLGGYPQFLSCPNWISVCWTTRCTHCRSGLTTASAKYKQSNWLALGCQCCWRMAPVLAKVFLALSLAPCTAHRPEAKSQGGGPHRGQELNIHKTRKKYRGQGLTDRNNDTAKSGFTGTGFDLPLLKVNIWLLERWDERKGRRRQCDKRIGGRKVRGLKNRFRWTLDIGRRKADRLQRSYLYRLRPRSVTQIH